MVQVMFGKSIALAGFFAVLAMSIACTVTPASVSAQAVTFVVQHVAAPEGVAYGTTKVWTAEKCEKPVQLNEDKQRIICELERKTCQPCPYSDGKKCQALAAAQGYCSFLIQSTDRLPFPIIIGQGSQNPTCVYATYWDYTLRQQITIWRPC